MEARYFDDMKDGKEEVGHGRARKKCRVQIGGESGGPSDKGLRGCWEEKCVPPILNHQRRCILGIFFSTLCPASSLAMVFGTLVLSHPQAAVPARGERLVGEDRGCWNEDSLAGHVWQGEEGATSFFPRGMGQASRSCRAMIEAEIFAHSA